MQVTAEVADHSVDPGMGRCFELVLAGGEVTPCLTDTVRNDDEVFSTHTHALLLG